MILGKFDATFGRGGFIQGDDRVHLREDEVQVGQGGVGSTLNQLDLREDELDPGESGASFAEGRLQLGENRLHLKEFGLHLREDEVYLGVEGPEVGRDRGESASDHRRRPSDHVVHRLQSVRRGSRRGVTSDGSWPRRLARGSRRYGVWRDVHGVGRATVGGRSEVRARQAWAEGCSRTLAWGVVAAPRRGGLKRDVSGVVERSCRSCGGVRVGRGRRRGGVCETSEAGGGQWRWRRGRRGRWGMGVREGGSRSYPRRGLVDAGGMNELIQQPMCVGAGT